ncbi:MAG: rha78D [Herbinix sp.]|jgi:hypothetical protein|nr:rha78D [Herbinix sp.]
MKKVELNSEWIWCENNTRKNDKVIFRKTLHLEKQVEEAITYISVDTKYWLYVNEELVVGEGGLFRESMHGSGYADKVDLAPYLRVGKNVIVLFCWYFGNEGRNNSDSKEAGLIFECKALKIYSNSSFLCFRHPAYYETGEPFPAYLYGGYNLGFDGNNDIPNFYKLDFDDRNLKAAIIYPNHSWGQLYERPIPQIRRNELKICRQTLKMQKECVINLPYAMTYCPSFIVEAKGGEVIQICSDRYTINGGPGDEDHSYNAQRIEYRCHPGINKFESILYLFGEEIILRCSEPLNIIEIGYLETGYDCDIVGEFVCDCNITNALVQKAARTLYVCMRDNFMDCPDRERGQWIGDVSVQVPQSIFLLSNSALLLIKKAISDFIYLRRGDILVGNVPGAHSSELPAQSLNAISEIGLIADYYKYTGDITAIQIAFEPAVHYLKLWNIGEDGLLIGRNGDWRWFDHLHNVDEAVLENTWYYSAIRFALKMSEILQDHRFDEWLLTRKKSIEDNFNKYFWTGRYYSSGKVVDDRANALAVLSGLCPREKYPMIRKILLSVFNATIYMENYVLTALCEMGYREDAYKRMVSRYYNLSRNNNSTLWEDFYILGTKNHAWSGSPATIAFKYFMGIDTKDGFQTFSLDPDKTLFGQMHCKFYAKNGIVTIDVNNKIGEIRIDNQSDSILIK